MGNRLFNYEVFSGDPEFPNLIDIVDNEEPMLASKVDERVLSVFFLWWGDESADRSGEGGVDRPDRHRALAFLEPDDGPDQQVPTGGHADYEEDQSNPEGDQVVPEGPKDSRSSGSGESGGGNSGESGGNSFIDRFMKGSAERKGCSGSNGSFVSKGQGLPRNGGNSEGCCWRVCFGWVKACGS